MAVVSVGDCMGENTGATKAGRFWFFHHNHARGHNGVYFDILCRVWEQTAEKTLAVIKDAGMGTGLP